VLEHFEAFLICFCRVTYSCYCVVVQSGRTVTHWAAAGGHADILKLVINNYSVDPDIRDEVHWMSCIANSYTINKVTYSIPYTFIRYWIANIEQLCNLKIRNITRIDVIFKFYDFYY